MAAPRELLLLRNRLMSRKSACPCTRGRVCRAELGANALCPPRARLRDRLYEFLRLLLPNLRLLLCLARCRARQIMPRKSRTLRNFACVIRTFPNTGAHVRRVASCTSSRCVANSMSIFDEYVNQQGGLGLQTSFIRRVTAIPSWACSVWYVASRMFDGRPQKGFSRYTMNT